MNRLRSLLAFATCVVFLHLTGHAATENFAINIGDVVTDGFVNTTATPGAGNIGSLGEVDVYTFTGTAGQLVYFHATGPTSYSYGFNWEVTRPGGAVLFSAD